MTATKNWWGDPTGPSSWSFGSGTSTSPDVNFFPWATNVGATAFNTCTSGLNVTSAANQAILCATPGTGNAVLTYTGSGSALLLGNAGSDQLIGSTSGTTYIIIGGMGTNTVNGNGGAGFIQERNTMPTLVNTGGDTIAA